MLALIIQLISGAVGGNLVGALAKNLNLGTLWNSVAGIIGGGIGGQLLGLVLPGVAAAAASGNLDIASILSQVASGGVGGGVLMALVGIIRPMLSK